MKRFLVIAFAVLVLCSIGPQVNADPTTAYRLSPTRNQFELTSDEIGTTGLTDVDTYLVMPDSGSWIVDFACSNGDAADDLDDFAIYVKRHPSDTWSDFLSGTDWQTATSSNPFTQDLAAIGEGDKASARVDLGAFYAIGFRASAAASGPVDSITVRGRIGPR